MDRLWSLCPPVYCLIVAAALGFGAARVNLMTVLACLWGARLTFNAARKGAFRRGGEDYRWAAVRERFGARGFQVFNAIFTPAQMVLIWLFTAPVHQAWRWREAPLGSLDLLATLLFVALLTLETVADQQMWAFQQDKSGASRPASRASSRSSAPGCAATPAIPTTSARSACGGAFCCSPSRRRASGCTGRVSGASS